MLEHLLSFQSPLERIISTQSSPPELFGSPLFQLLYVKGEPPAQVKIPSCAMSFSPIQVQLCDEGIANKATAFSAADVMVARSRPRDRQSVRASCHVRRVLKNWYCEGVGGEDGGEGGDDSRVCVGRGEQR